MERRPGTDARGPAIPPAQQKMILVDTSMWVELLTKRPSRTIREQDLLRFATCGPVVQEVFQGLRPGPQSDAFRLSFLAIPVLSDPIPLNLFLSAAEI